MHRGGAPYRRRRAGSALSGAAAFVLLAFLLPTSGDAQGQRPVARSATYTAREVDLPSSRAGRGGGAAVEFEVTGDGAFPARASDPVLYVGSVAIRKYRYADIANRTLVFTLPDASVLEEGAPVRLQYEPDRSLRLDMPALRLDAIQRRGIP